MDRALVLAALVATGCNARLHAGYDATASVRGPLANLQSIPRIAAITGDPDAAPAAPEGRTINAGIGFGDRLFQIGLGIRANNIATSTLDAANGPQYLSAAASLDFRYTFVRIKGISTNIVLAPTRTLLVDSAAGSYSWGSGVRYGGGLQLQLGSFGVFADAYQEKIIFGEGPAHGNSTRNGVTIGLAVQP
ncbi:MAG: hypothetical protein JNL83_02905 [Myxococcales bacterium]|nr:hypothetical protein [Myxococcales bacterium]